MTELVQLERRHAEFPKRSSRVIVVSVEGLDDARKTQVDFPHLTVLSDEERGLSEAAGLIHPHAAPDGGDADVPTTILVDRRGACALDLLFAERDRSAVVRRGVAGDRPEHPMILRRAGGFAGAGSSRVCPTVRPRLEPAWWIRYGYTIESPP